MRNTENNVKTRLKKEGKFSKAGSCSTIIVLTSAQIVSQTFPSSFLNILGNTAKFIRIHPKEIYMLYRQCKALHHSKVGWISFFLDPTHLRTQMINAMWNKFDHSYLFSSTYFSLDAGFSSGNTLTMLRKLTFSHSITGEECCIYHCPE